MSEKGPVKIIQEVVTLARDIVTDYTQAVQTEKEKRQRFSVDPAQVSRKEELEKAQNLLEKAGKPAVLRQF